MKDFIVYLLPRLTEGSVRKIYALSEFIKLPKTSRLAKEFESVVDGELELVKELRTHRVFKFPCKYRMPKSASAKGEAPVSNLDFEVWQMKEGPFAVTFSAPRKPSRIAIAMLSYSVYGQPFLISRPPLTPTYFTRLKDRILLERKGHLTQVILRGIKSEKERIRKFELAGENLEDAMNVQELLKSASRIVCLRFTVPLLVGERMISFRILDWGGGQIYSPADPLDHEILELLRLLSQDLFIPSSSSA